MKEKKIIVFYYSQSGQTKQIAQSLCEPLKEGGCEIIFKEIVPERPYPYLWSYDNFFEAFAECRAGDPPYGIKEIDLTDAQDADLVIVAGQSWFLSPSLPIQSFFISPQIRQYIKNKNIIFVNGCRNMWLSTIRDIRTYAREIGANLVGHIVLQDRNPNLISVFTIIRWLFYGKKESTKFLPAAGISDADISGASLFGREILEFMNNGNGYADLQEELMKTGAIEYKPGVLFAEKIGHRVFGLWSKFIRRKGGYEDKARHGRIMLFSYYLFFILYIALPIGLTVFYLTYPIRMLFFKKQKREACYNLK